MPASPGTPLYIGPDGGPFTVVGSANALPVTANAGTGTFVVAGTVLAGNPPSGGPVYVGGNDGTNVRGISTDTSGRVVLSPTTGGVALSGTTANGLSKGKIRNLAATVTAVKASAGTLYGLQIINNQGAACYVQLFDLATGSVTLGTTTPDLEFLVAANTQLNVPLPSQGVPFGTAISIASTTTEGGSTGSAAGVFVYPQYQ